MTVALAGNAPAPSPPPGPGVVPPFPKPPEERRVGTLLIALGVGAAALVICGGAAVAGVIGVLAWANNDITEKARTAATRFMDDIVAQNFRGAYEQQCEELREDVTVAEFTDEWEDARISRYSLGNLVATDEHPMVQEVRVTLSGGNIQKIGLVMRTQAATKKGEPATFVVCGAGTFAEDSGGGG